MKLILYNTNTPTNALIKQLKNKIEVDGTLKDSTSILTPSIALEAVTTPLYNYCYIPSFNRYYFITDITKLNNKLIKIDCKVDVLMSFSNDIKNSYGKANHAIKINSYYERLEISKEVRNIEEKINFPEIPFTNKGTIVLVALNGTGVN